MLGQESASSCACKFSPAHLAPPPQGPAKKKAAEELLSAMTHERYGIWGARC